MGRGPRVLLVHGLWYGRPSLWPLAQRLRAYGLVPSLFGYSTVLTAPADSADALAGQARALAADTLHFVGHSLGGLLILRMLERHGAELPPGRVVLLGSPLTGSVVARRIAAVPGLSRALGRSVELLDRGVSRLPADRDVGAVAGTLPLGLGRWFAPLMPPHDGTVSVAETRIDGLADHLELPVSHTGMVLSAAVAAAAARFLTAGAFGPA